MPEITTNEGLMIFLINLFAEKFPQSAILKGGMSLRLLECPQLTNDIDYIFIPFKSKKDIVAEIISLLDEIENLDYQYSLNSKCLRIKISYGEFATQIEANVAMECPTTSISTTSIARENGLLGQVVQVVSYETAMANKLAAWNERHLVRDLFDLYFYYSRVRVMPDTTVLRERLKKISSNLRNKNPKSMTLMQLIGKLKKRLESLSADDMLEIADYMPSDELSGLEIKIRTQLLQLCSQLEDQIQ